MEMTHTYYVGLEGIFQHAANNPLVVEMGFSVRATKAIRRAFFNRHPKAHFERWRSMTAMDVSSFSLSELAQLPNVGETTLTEIRERLSEVGVYMQ